MIDISLLEEICLIYVYHTEWGILTLLVQTSVGNARALISGTSNWSIDSPALFLLYKLYDYQPSGLGNLPEQELLKDEKSMAAF